MIKSHLIPTGPRRRRGYGLIEMGVAGVLLATMTLLTLQLVGWSARDRQSVARREAARVLVANVLERVLARPFAEITTDGIAPLVAALGADRPPALGTLRVEVTPAESVAGLSRKKVVVEVFWPRNLAEMGSPVRLIAWTTTHPGGTTP